MQITFLGMPLKSLLALVIVWAGFKLFNEEIARQALMWITTIGRMIHMLNPGAAYLDDPTGSVGGVGS